MSAPQPEAHQGHGVQVGEALLLPRRDGQQGAQRLQLRVDLVPASLRGALGRPAKPALWGNLPRERGETPSPSSSSSPATPWVRSSSPEGFGDTGRCPGPAGQAARLCLQRPVAVAAEDGHGAGTARPELAELLSPPPPAAASEPADPRCSRPPFVASRLQGPRRGGAGPLLLPNSSRLFLEGGLLKIEPRLQSERGSNKRKLGSVKRAWRLRRGR